MTSLSGSVSGSSSGFPAPPERRAQTPPGALDARGLARRLDALLSPNPRRVTVPWPGSVARRGRFPRFGYPLRYFDEVPSTNDVALEWAGEGAPEGATVLASAQNQGRGRSGRSWVSEAGAGLWFTVVLRPALRYPAAGMLPLTVGFGLVSALRRLGLDASVKWPNDVLVYGRKVAGVLIESRPTGDRLAVAVAGIGVNWLEPELGGAGRTGEAGGTQGPEDRRVGLLATGLAREFARRGVDAPAPEEVFSRLLAGVERAYLVLRVAGPAPFEVAWPRFSAHYGRPVAERGGVRGLGGAILPDGSLELVLPGGRRKRLVSGEISLELTGTNQRRGP